MKHIEYMKHFFAAVAMSAMLAAPLGMSADINEQSAKQVMDDSPIMVNVEAQPQFEGGTAALMNWLAHNIHYPEDAQAEGAQGRVLVQFVVEKNGTITNATILRGQHPSLNAEALRVVSAMPAWIPAKTGGKAVRCHYTLPISFKL